MQTTTVQLGRGGKIHAAHVREGYMSSPMCGGNKATEGYREVRGEVDCKNCQKITAAEAAKREVEPETATNQGENAVTVEAEPKYTFATPHPATGKPVVIPSARPAKWAAWEGAELFGLSNLENEGEALSTLPKGRTFVLTAISPISPEKGTDSAMIARDASETPEATTEKGTEMPPRAKKTAAQPAVDEAELSAVIKKAKELIALVSAAVAEGADAETLADRIGEAEKAIEDLPAGHNSVAAAMLKKAKAGESSGDETADAIERVKDLTAQVFNIAEAGESADVERAKELEAQAEAIILDLPTEYRTDLRAALAQAKRGESPTDKKAAKKAVAKKAAPKVVATRETQDYKKAIPDAEKLVAEVAKAYATGVEAEKANALVSRTIAEKVLAARLFLTDKDGHPDIHGKSHGAKQLSADFYAAAGAGFERTEENEDALDRLVKAVHNIRQDVLVKRVRAITPEDAEKFFPLALKANPDADPATAIRKFYSIPERSTWELSAEKQRLVRQATKALREGDEKKAKELETAAKNLGKSDEQIEKAEAAAQITPAEKKSAKRRALIKAAHDQLAELEKEFEKVPADEAQGYGAELEALAGKVATLAGMFKNKK